MKQMTTYEVLKASIKKVSKTYNDKALKEIINDNGIYDDLNTLMFKYYKRVHKKDYITSFNVREYDINDLQDFKQVMKDYKKPFYKRLYDYKGFQYQPIKAYNTLCIVEIATRYHTFSHYAFNVYAFMYYNDISLVIQHNGMLESVII